MHIQVTNDFTDIDKILNINAIVAIFHYFLYKRINRNALNEFLISIFDKQRLFLKSNITSNCVKFFKIIISKARIKIN